MNARKSLLSMAVLVAVSGVAFADGGSVNTSQTGDKNLLNVLQSDANGSNVTVNQTGARNDSIVRRPHRPHGPPAAGPGKRTRCQAIRAGPGPESPK